MKKLSKFFALLALLFITLNSPAWDKIDPSILARADKGVNAIYNLDLATARAELSSLLEEYPNYPLGLFGQVYRPWTPFSMNQRVMARTPSGLMLPSLS